MKCWRLNMHELSICQAIIDQVEEIARNHHGQRVVSITVQIGPLSGAEAPLIQRAYPLAAAGSIAEHATLELEAMPIRVHCKICHEESDASANRLLCGVCGDFHTELISGDEMLLASVELDKTFH